LAALKQREIKPNLVATADLFERCFSLLPADFKKNNFILGNLFLEMVS